MHMVGLYESKKKFQDSGDSDKEEFENLDEFQETPLVLNDNEIKEKPSQDQEGGGEKF